MKSGLLNPNKEAPTDLEKALKRLRKGFVGVGVTSFFLNLLMLATPLYMLSVYQRVLTSGHQDTLIYLTVITVFALLVLGLLYCIRGWLLSRISNWLSASLGSRIFTACVDGVIAGSPTGGAVPLRDLRQLQTFIGGQGLATLFDAPWVPIFVIIIWVMHPYLGMLALIGAILLFGLAFVNEMVLREAQKAASRQHNMATQFAENAMHNSEVIQAMGMMEGLLSRFRSISAGAFQDQDAVNSRSAIIVGASRFIRLSLQVGVLGVGAMLVLAGELSPGHMIAGAILLGRALAPVEQAMGAWTGFIQCRSSYERLQELLNAIPETEKAISLPTPKGKIVVEGATLRIPKTEKLILQNISFALEPGETLAVIGSSASGKSSLCRLLVGVYPPTFGSVRMDGAEVHTWERGEFGKHVGYLPQGLELFSGTVRQNIARMADDVPDEEIVAAAQRAAAHEMILQLPDGYDTLVVMGSGAGSLSAGQRQRIGLARSLLGNPKLLVLDEPNTNLDQFAEETLLRTLNTLKSEGVTIIIVAHHWSLMKTADKVLKLNQGKVEVFGIPKADKPEKLAKPKELAKTEG